jgi:hypothetical protein
MRTTAVARAGRRAIRTDEYEEADERHRTESPRNRGGRAPFGLFFRERGEMRDEVIRVPSKRVQYCLNARRAVVAGAIGP